MVQDETFGRGQSSQQAWESPVCITREPSCTTLSPCLVGMVIG